MVYHCTINTAACTTACDCPLLPLGGPLPGGDIVDEALSFWRANVLFRSFEVVGAGDKLLLYISIYIGHCLQRLVEVQADRAVAEKLLFSLAHERYRLPGEVGFPLGGLFSPPQSPAEQETIRTYLRHCREAAGRRLIAKCFLPDDTLSKHWAAFACRRFLNKAMA